MYTSLVDGGWFVTSSLDNTFVNPEFYTFENFTRAILYKKHPHSKLKNVTPDPSPLPLAYNKEYIIKQAPPWKMQCKSKDKEQAKKDPKDPKIMDPTLLEMKARELANKGQLTEAQELCLQALAVDKLNPLLYYLRATIRQEAGKTKEAADALKKALFLDPKFILAHFTLGYLAQQTCDHQEAARHLQNALKAAEAYAKTDLVPASDGLSVGNLIDSIITMTEGGIKS